MLPVDGSIAMPLGSLNWPLPLPEDPKAVTYSPLSVNSCRGLLLAFTTHTFPLEVIAMLRGALSWPAPEPAIPALQLLVQISNLASPLLTPHPKAAWKTPLSLNFSIRLLRLSETKTLPLAATAMPLGSLNWPS